MSDASKLTYECSWKGRPKEPRAIVKGKRGSFCTAIEEVNSNLFSTTWVESLHISLQLLAIRTSLFSFHVNNYIFSVSFSPFSFLELTWNAIFLFLTIKWLLHLLASSSFHYKIPSLVQPYVMRIFTLINFTLLGFSYFIFRLQEKFFVLRFHCSKRTNISIFEYRIHSDEFINSEWFDTMTKVT